MGWSGPFEGQGGPLRKGLSHQDPSRKSFLGRKGIPVRRGEKHIGTGTLKQQDRGQRGHVTGGGLLCTMRALGRPGALDLYPRVGSFLEERGKARGVRVSARPPRCYLKG